MTAVSVAGSSASASAATQGNGPNGSFYNIPSAPFGDSHGTLLYYNTTKSSQIKVATGYNIAYVSQDASNAPDVVTGSLWIPTAAWTGKGSRPLVSFAVGTQGLGVQCAPSKELAAGSEYDVVGMNDALKAGYAVVATDYQWSGTTDTPPPTYMVGLSQGHAVLDAAIAATQLPSSGLSSSTPVITWGYSQGGGASAEAAQLQPSYAPSGNLVADASGGVPGNLLDVANALNGGLAAGFAGDAVVGFSSAYPDLPLASLLNSTGQSFIANLKKQCMIGELLSGLFKNFDKFTNGGLTLAQVEAKGNWTPDVLANSTGMPGAHIAVPTYMYRGIIDEIIPPTVEDAVYANLCATGTKIQAATYPGEHLLTDYEAAGNVVSFIGQVINGQSTTNSCTTNSKSL